MAEFEYDVAFSFHQADQGLAQQLNDLLAGRFRTFIYTEQQKVLAGTDGEITFNAVYGGKARVVVVFCRKEWGETPFTRIEMTAIKNRGFEEGLDFTLFIPTDEPPTTPKWLPRTQLWFGLRTFGLQAAAAVVEHKIQSLGGEVHVESVAERGARAKRARDLAAAQQRFLNSDQGVNAAREAYFEVLDRLRSDVEEVKQASGLPIAIVEKQDTKDEIVIHGLNGSVYVSFPVRYTNVLEDVPVLVNFQDGPPKVWWLTVFEEPRSWAKDRYQYSLLGPDRRAFQEVGGAAREFTPADLAGHILRRYIDLSEKHHRPRR
ncbi:hypothetical protein [Aureimonas sp. Leaf324]|uniref:hypothetical protein n=1 Tax=Aureimonas sp. Leaf324 TaxID=1736336 RepID=UPI0006FFF528|nr:hypothetical protein [Aureimonas sp. Leaf324]KQQ90977.1 hypothetical protein ASF65_00085 [Aureimonas sp. Leaf324]